ncbi:MULTISPECIES: ABC transporter substrate-binding protein [unclassified Beijerinckia]|uniref:heme/hemin ABC transporter substrate-binding protein n=1 Tax=unclassified Beijerinckia TaxID=2638183 RepID=UPI0008966237|nr:MULTISPECIES: ABC transporter substrate-binding protein [unclassified Beijerinckia]MDH7795046.1 iron complex transport system substrate-binding protein [Beijerinckia sp. GAS462]SEB85392.1 iron complex transport system substrate-binding protein [Beijerinckia sp. 28-YEA-48]
MKLVAIKGALASLLLLSGNGLAHAERPSRLVSLGSSNTEIIYALDAADAVVGVDSTSLLPPQALATKANVGYLRALSAEGLLALRPDMVLTSAGAGPPDVLENLRRAGIKLVNLDDVASAESLLNRIDAIGHLVERESAAQQLHADVAKRFESLTASVAKIANRRRALLVLGMQSGKAMVAGRKTAADAMIHLAGAVNAGDGMDGYKPMSDEAIVAAAPDVIIWAHRPGEDVVQDVFSMPAFATTPAATNKAIVRMDAIYLLGFGPSAPEAAKDLMRQIYGDEATSK